MTFSEKSVRRARQFEGISGIEEKLTAFGLDQARYNLSAALDQPDNEFRQGQFEAIEQVVEHKARTLFVQATINSNSASEWNRMLNHLMDNVIREFKMFLGEVVTGCVKQGW